jgi:hypothetical protein
MPNFRVHQTINSCPYPLEDMTETEVYAHVRTRLSYGVEAAEAMLRRLREKGKTTERGTDSVGVETIIEVQAV